MSSEQVGRKIILLNMFDAIANFPQIVKLCRQSKVGKILPDAFYIHISAIAELDDLLVAYEAEARELLGRKDNNYNILKFGLSKPQISYLSYPEFESDPHPRLKSSLIVNLQTQGIDYRDYTDSKNPPILHRKETFISKQHDLYDKFSHLTRCEQEIGLLKLAKQIGFLKQWQQFLNLNHIKFEDHYLACPLNKASSQNKLLDIDRHKAAIVRNDLSRPVKLALEANLLSDKVSFFDYGCGHGGDVNRLASQGIKTAGWDPHYFPDNSLKSADVINVGYVINVIVIKFHTSKPQISYLHYPNFDDDPHPLLKTSMRISLRNLRVSYRDYQLQDDTPILHQKDLLVTQDYPDYQKFAKLTAQENNWNLLSDWQQIRTYGGWQTWLEEHCAELRGHRVCFRKDADPYKLKILKAGIQKRRKQNQG